MQGQPAALRNRIKVKSGSMNGVRCYSGYILPDGYADYEAVPDDAKDNIIVFSIMTNNCTSPTWKVRPLLDKMMVALAGEN
jgi:D-alanyl-D-alanine carboxypeptidase/D-alanyl-D-alanine-endopeptidase (penicillin-binding protein 4)